MPITPGTTPVAGHATRLYCEVDPDGAQGTFTLIPEITSSIDVGSKRENTVITPHGAGVGSKIVAQVMELDDIQTDMTYKFANAVHQALHSFYLENKVFGLMQLGPEGTAPSADCVIQSGQVTSWKQMGPVRNGEYKCQWVFTSTTGAVKINGTIYT